MTSHCEASVMEVPQGPPEQQLSTKTAQPTVLPRGTLNSCAQNTEQVLPLWVPELEGDLNGAVTGLMALPQVAFKKATSIWDLCAGPDNHPDPGYCYPVRGTAAKGAIPTQQKLLTSRDVLHGLRNQYDIERIMALLDRPGPAYSCVILGYGALGCIQRTCVDKISAIRFWGGVGGANIKNPATPLAPQIRRTMEYCCTA